MMESFLWLAAHVLLSALAAAGATGKIEQVAWLQGCWQLDAGGRVVEEQWMAPRGGAMLSMGRTVRDGRLVEYESVVLRERDGLLAYEAHPSGQAPATFLSVTIDAATVVFENPTHDFPQRVGYERKGDSLLGWIEGTVNGQSRRVEFPYRRVACAGASK
jgi:Domain of unknown function (DUF6265)